MAAASTAVIAGSLNAAALALRPFTVIRVVGSYFLRSDQTAASENYEVAWGMAVVSDQALVVGVTAVPTPYTDLDSDLWFQHKAMSSRFEFVSGVGFETAVGLSGEYESKAARKVEDGSDMIIVLETSSIFAGSVLALTARVLIKLH